jgi:four helix bundle protein
MKNDLFKRILEFSVNVIELCQLLGKGIEERNIRSQISRCATSVGANYQESQSASSRADFINKLSISLKELNETIFWLFLIERTFGKMNPSLNSKLNPLINESEQLQKILNACILTARQRGERR